MAKLARENFDYKNGFRRVDQVLNLQLKSGAVMKPYQLFVVDESDGKATPYSSDSHTNGEKIVIMMSEGQHETDDIVVVLAAGEVAEYVIKEADSDGDKVTPELILMAMKTGIYIVK